MPKLPLNRRLTIGDYNSSNVVQNKRGIRASEVNFTRGQSRTESGDQMLRGIPRSSFEARAMSEGSFTTAAFLFQQSSGNAAARTLYYDHLWAACGLDVGAKASGTITATPETTEADQGSCQFEDFRGDDALIVDNAKGSFVMSSDESQQVNIAWTFQGKNTSENFLASGSRTALTNPDTQPLLARNATLSISATGLTIPTLIVTSFEFDLGAEVTPISDITDAIGFDIPAIVGFKPKLTLQVEAPITASGTNIVRQMLTTTSSFDIELRLFCNGSSTLDSLYIDLNSAQLMEAPNPSNNNGTFGESLAFSAVDTTASNVNPFAIRFLDEVNN